MSSLELNLSKNLKNKNVIGELISSNSTSFGNSIEKIDIDRLIAYRRHPFKLYEDERLSNMVGSIKQHGILSPIIVRPDGISNNYEILSGHNRTNAAKLAGLKQVPIEIRIVDDDIADMIVVESNFVQRMDFLPSEKAKAYKLQLDALNRQGKKDNLCSNGTEVENSRDIVAKNNSTSSVQIQRYIRLNYLTDELLELVDKNTLSFRPAVEISYIDMETQINILNVIESGSKISLKQASLLKKEAESKILSIDDILDLLAGKKNEKRTIEIPFDKIKNYFPDSVTENEIIEKIVGLLNS